MQGVNTSYNLPPKTHLNSRPLEIITCEGLHDILRQPQLNIHIWDVRIPSEFLKGHIKWRETPGAVCGVINFDPTWMSMPG